MILLCRLLLSFCFDRDDIHCIKHLRQFFIGYSNTLNFIKMLCGYFQLFPWCFDILLKSCLSYLKAFCQFLFLQNNAKLCKLTYFHMKSIVVKKSAFYGYLLENFCGMENKRNLVVEVVQGSLFIQLCYCLSVALLAQVNEVPNGPDLSLF